MPKLKVVLKQKVIKINEQQQKLLDVFTGKWGFTSESEVFRQALIHFYRDMEPAYTQRSPRQQEKAKELEEQKRIENLSDEDWATEILKGKVVKNPHGRRYVLAMTEMNSIKVWPLDEVRGFIERDPYHMEAHHRMLDKKDFNQYIRDYGKWRLQEIGMTVEEVLGEVPHETENK